MSPDPLLAGRSDARPGSQNPWAQVERPHIASRLEDALDRRIAARLVRRGWTVRVVPYTGYGGPGWVRVLARTQLAAPHVADRDLPDSGATQGSAESSDLRGWRSFLTAPVAGTRVRVRIGEQVHTLVADRAGYVDAIVGSELPSGWQDVTLRVAGGEDVVCPIQVVDATARLGVVSDIDDTVMVTRLPRPLVAFWNSFVRRTDARESVPGMAGLLRAVCACDPGAPMVYLSTGAWDTAPTIARFLRVNRFPRGTLLMTDWGPTNTGWFRSGPRHKVTQLRRLFTELPQVAWWLVGDDGQHDPSIYAGALRHHPSHVAVVALRQLTFAEHVLSAGISGVTDLMTPQGRWATAVPVLGGPDGHALAAQARARGLLPDAT